MTDAEFAAIAERVTKVARAGGGTGNNEQDKVLEFDAPLLAGELGKRLNADAALGIVLRQARIENPSKDPVLHARQVVEKMWEKVMQVGRLEDRLDEYWREIGQNRGEIERLRKDVLAAEGREKALELKLEAATKAKKKARG